MDITKVRLFNQHLIGEKFQKVEQVVEHLGAVQAQDFTAAKWSLGQRLNNSSDAKIETAFNQGKIIRTHIMRPTWHFVMPEDLVWMQELTAANVKRLMASYNRKLELDDELFKKTNSLIVESLKGHNYLTRQELKKILEGIGIKTDVQRLAHIVMWAELDSLICSGPLKGKQFTYVLVEERVKKVKNLNREESLTTLALKYFQSHGPAQLKDFAWWSGLSAKDANEALAFIKSKLNHEAINDRTYWFFPPRHSGVPLGGTIKSRVLLLSIYDEYTIAYNDRGALSEKNDIERMISMGNALTAVIIINGKVAGTWKRTIRKNSVEIKLSPFRKLSKAESDAIQIQVETYGKFVGLKAELI